MPTYLLYGVTLLCDRPLSHRMAVGTGSPELALSFADPSWTCSHTHEAGCAYSSPHRTEAGEPVLRIRRAAACDLLDFAGVAAFHVGDDHVVCVAPDPRHAYVPIHFLGTVMAFWLERNGFLTLHASAVVVEPELAIGFLSDSGSGKSALAAQFLAAGDALLTDDILVLDQRGETLGRPGYPQVRLWPDQADHFLGSHADLDLVDPALAKRRVPIGDGRFGRFHDTPAPLRRLYLAERQPADAGRGVTIEDVPPSRAAVELVRHTFSFRIVEAMGWQPRRLGQIADAVRTVPVRRLRFPTGYGHLARVREEVLRDLRS